MLDRPVIDAGSCDGCGLCVGVCHLDGLAIENGVVVFLGIVECDWCADCELVCPSGAITCPFEIVLQES